MNSDAAGQHLTLTGNSGTLDKGSISPVEAHMSRVIGRFSSDSDSNDSIDTRMPKDTESEASVSSTLSRQEGSNDMKRQSPLLRQSSDGTDSFMAKTMAWNSSSIDNGFSEFSDSSVADPHEQVSRINEASIGYTSRLRHAWDSMSSDGTVGTDQTSVTAGDGDTLSETTVRASLASLPRDSDLGDDSSEQNGSRSSPDLSGRGT